MYSLCSSEAQGFCHFNLQVPFYRSLPLDSFPSQFFSHEKSKAEVWTYCHMPVALAPVMLNRWDGELEVTLDYRVRPQPLSNKNRKKSPRLRKDTLMIGDLRS